VVRIATDGIAGSFNFGKSGNLPLTQPIHQRKCADPRMIALGTKLGIDATKKLPGECFKRPWPPLIKMDEQVQETITALFGGET
jgi:hypothetical protein